MILKEYTHCSKVHDICHVDKFSSCTGARNSNKNEGTDRYVQGDVGIIILDWGLVGWFSCQATKKILEPQDIWLKNCIDGCQDAL